MNTEQEPTQPPYNSVAELRNTVILPNTPLPLRLRGGRSITGVTPTAITPDLQLQFVNPDNTAESIPLGDLNGIEVIEVDGQKRVRFTYFNPKTGMPEEQPREIVYKDLYYGTAPGHAAIGEKPDYYIRGDDKQYLEGQGDRTFPLWRMGAYGDSEQASQSFMPDQE